MTELVTQVGTVLTAFIGWGGDILGFVVAEPLLMIGATFTILGSAIGFVHQVRQ